MQDCLIERTERIVVAFDMRSSTKILENLSEKGNEAKFLDLWDELAEVIRERSTHDTRSGHIVLHQIDFIPSKFTGDGWLLIFPLDTEPLQIIRLLHQISLTFASRFLSIIQPVLTASVTSGLRFGMDCGPLLRYPM